MNTDPIISLAARLVTNPAVLVDAEEQALRDLLVDHASGLLEPAIAAQAQALIHNDPLAASIWAELQSLEERLNTSDGKAWLNSPVQGMSAESMAKPHDPGHETFFTRLSDWLTDLFGTGLLNESYAADATDDQIVKSFPAASGEPFEVELVKDGVGRWFLRVFTKDASAAANVLAVDMGREAPVLRFAPVSETLFEAEVRISETMAQALSAGHRPVFRPAE